MIIGTGVDIEEVARFTHWRAFSPTQLRRIFSQQEIDYCVSVPAKSAERFAVRFAAREALFKALCRARDQQELAQSCVLSGCEFQKIPFLTLCKMVRIERAGSGAPFFVVGPDLNFFSGLQILLSLSHSSSMAIAMVTIQRV